MESGNSSASTGASAPQQSDSGSSTEQGNIGAGEYKVSASDLAEMGLDASSFDDSVDGDSFEFGNISAEPPPVKEQRLAKAKAKLQPKETEPEAELLDDGDEILPDDWLEQELAPKDEEEVAEETTEEEEPIIELIRKGEKHPFKLSQVRDYAQKGFDYEVKTRELKQQRQAFESEKSQIQDAFQKLQSEFEKVRTEKEQIDALVDFIKDNDADVYANIERYAGEFNRQYNNPMISRLVQTLEQKIESKLGGLEKFKEEARHKELRSDFDKQMSDLRRFHEQKFEKYGIDLDEKAIQQEWIESGLPLKKIYGQMYGDKLLSLRESKSKLDIKRKSVSKAPTMGRMKTATKPTADVMAKLKKMPYERIADMAIKGLLK